MSRSFAKDFVILSLGTIINIAISAITTPIITRIVDPADYGQYSLMLTYGSILAAVVSLGLNQAIVRFFYTSEDLSYRKSLLRFCFLIPSALTVVSCVLVVAYFVFVASASLWEGLLWGIVFSLYLASLTLGAFSQLVARLQFKTVLLSVSTVMNKVVFVVLALACVLATSLNDGVSLVFATAIAGFVIAIVQIAYDKEIWNCFGRKSKAVSIPRASIMRYALPVWLSSGVAIVLQGVDKVSLDFFTTAHEVGIYASAFAIVNIFSVVQSSFNTLWAPTAIERYEKDPNDTSFYVRGNDMITVAMFALGILIIMFKDVFILLLGPAYREASTLIPYLIFYPIFYTISETTVSGINFAKKTIYHAFISIGSLVIAVVSLTISVPLLGVEGAALSMALTYAGFFLLRSFFGTKCFPTPFHFAKIAAVSLSAFLYATLSTFWLTPVVSALLGVPFLAISLLVYREAATELLRKGISKVKERFSGSKESADDPVGELGEGE